MKKKVVLIKRKGFMKLGKVSPQPFPYSIGVDVTAQPVYVGLYLGRETGVVPHDIDRYPDELQLCLYFEGPGERELDADEQLMWVQYHLESIVNRIKFELLRPVTWN